jgi:hypothetical protein
MTNPNPAYAQPHAGLPPAPCDDLAFDLMEWIKRNIHLDDPVELRRNDRRGWAEAAGFAEVDVCATWASRTSGKFDVVVARTRNVPRLLRLNELSGTSFVVAGVKSSRVNS